jgi:uncharacterized spore protein YtfJ
MDIKQWCSSLVDRLQSSASVKSVYGEPIVTEGKTIIPVARVGYGFGMGGGGQLVKDDLESEKPAPYEGGGGGGGGAGAIPVGVLEVTSDKTRFIRFGEERRLAIALLSGVVLGLWISKRRDHTK